MRPVIEGSAKSKAEGTTMRHSLTLLTALLLVSLVCLSSAQVQQTRKPAKADEAKAIADAINAPVEKDPRVQSDGKPWGINKATVSDPTRPRVLLIGDSILNGYANTVIKRLAGKAYVDYWVTPACQSEGFNKMLAMVLKNGPYDVVHINLGLHGFQRDRVVRGMTEKQPRIPDGQFEPLTKSFVEVMRKENPQGKIIWASTTPISLRDKPTELDPQNNPIIVEHNRMAAKVMAEMNVPVNDLYTLSVKRLDLKQNDFHWKDGAKKLQGDAVADCVLKLLAVKKRS
jgi:lysophospholipase L1-like esterase